MASLEQQVRSRIALAKMKITEACLSYIGSEVMNGNLPKDPKEHSDAKRNIDQQLAELERILRDQVSAIQNVRNNLSQRVCR